MQNIVGGNLIKYSIGMYIVGEISLVIVRILGAVPSIVVSVNTVLLLCRIFCRFVRDVVSSCHRCPLAHVT